MQNILHGHDTRAVLGRKHSSDVSGDALSKTSCKITHGITVPYSSTQTVLPAALVAFVSEGYVKFSQLHFAYMLTLLLNSQPVPQTGDPSSCCRMGPG